MDNTLTEARKHLRYMSSGYHMTKAFTYIIDELVRLRAEEQRLTNELVELKMNINREKYKNG